MNLVQVSITATYVLRSVTGAVWCAIRVGLLDHAIELALMQPYLNRIAHVKLVCAGDDIALRIVRQRIAAPQHL